MTKTWGWLCWLGVLGLLLNACQGAAPPTPRSPLRIAWNLWPGFYPVLIAQAQGLFAKHGVTVELVLYDTYQNQFPDFVAGSLDGAFTGLYDILAPATTRPTRVVLITDNSDGAEGLVTAPDIVTVQDLTGKRVGVILGSIGEFFLTHLLREHGLTVNDVTLVNVGPEEVPQALLETVQAGYTWEPHLSAVTTQNYQVLASTADSPGLVPDVVAFGADIVAERPEEVRGFVAAWFEASAWWQTHFDEGNALIARATGLNAADISLVGVQTFDIDANRRAFAPGTDTLSLYYTGQLQLDFLISTGALTTAPDINELLDPQFLP